MIFTHVPATDDYRIHDRARGLPHHTLSIVVLDRTRICYSIDRRNITRSYRAMRRAGMTAHAARGIVWDCVVAGQKGSVRDNDVHHTPTTTLEFA